MIFNFFQIFFNLKNYFQNYFFLITWTATGQKLNGQQQPRGETHAKSVKMWGQGPFPNKKTFAGMFQFYFSRHENQNCPNYRDENHI